MHSLIPAQSWNSPLLLVWARFIHVSLRLEACQEPLIVRASLHWQSLPALFSPGYYMPTSFRLVRPRTTHRTNRGASSNTVCNSPCSRFDDWPHTPTRVFQRAYVLTHTHPENFPGGHPSQNCSRPSTLNLGVSKLRAPKKKMHLVDMGSTYKILCELSLIV